MGRNSLSLTVFSFFPFPSRSKSVLCTCVVERLHFGRTLGVFIRSGCLLLLPSSAHFPAGMCWEKEATWCVTV